MIERDGDEQRLSALERAAVDGDASEVCRELEAMGVGGFRIARGRAGLFRLSAKRMSEVGLALNLAARNGHAECVEALLKARLKGYAVARAAVGAAQLGRVEVMEALALRCDEAGRAEALFMAAARGELVCAGILIKAGVCEELIAQAMSVAADSGREELVRMMIPLCDPKYNQSAALASAAAQGSIECVRLLLPVSNARAKGSEALELAAGATSGSGECVRELLPVSNPLARNLKALKNAARYGNVEALNALLQVSDLASAKKATQRHALDLAIQGAREGAAEALECVSALLPCMSELAIKEMVEGAVCVGVGSAPEAIERARGYLQSLDERRELSETTSAAGDGERGARAGVRVRV